MGHKMAKSREKIQQLGFWDSEVSSPNHDMVALWAYENAELIFRQAYPEEFNRPWSQEEFDIQRGTNYPEWIKEAKSFADKNPRLNPRVSRKTLEYVLKSYTGHNNKLERIVGYADLLIDTESPQITGDYEYNECSGLPEKLKSVQVSWGRNFRSSQRILVEAKSVLPTVGELMRQIQLYRTAFSGSFVVVSPDDSYSQLLNEQNVVFVKYAP